MERVISDFPVQLTRDRGAAVPIKVKRSSGLSRRAKKLAPSFPAPLCPFSLAQTLFSFPLPVSLCSFFTTHEFFITKTRVPRKKPCDRREAFNSAYECSVLGNGRMEHVL